MTISWYPRVALWGYPMALEITADSRGEYRGVKQFSETWKLFVNATPVYEYSTPKLDAKHNLGHHIERLHRHARPNRPHAAHLCGVEHGSERLTQPRAPTSLHWYPLAWRP